MKKLLYIALCALIISGCKDDNPVSPADSVSGKPVVTLVSPANNYNAADSVAIEATATDDKGVVKVEFYIDNASGDFRTCYNKPYKYTWLTKQCADGSIHTIYAKAYDADGNSTTSDVINVTVYRLQPGNFKATFAADTLVQLKWQDNSSAETGFNIEQSVNGSAFSLIKSAKANDTSAVLTGPFYADSLYRFRVAAVTATGLSAYSNIDSVKFSLPKPDRFSVTIVSDTLFSFSWQDNSSTETGFKLEQSQDGNVFLPVKTFSRNSASGSLSGIYNAGQVYFFRIKAVTGYNSSAYSETVPVKFVVNSPSDIKIASLNNTSIKLSWKDNCAFSKWIQVERKTNTGDFIQVAKIANGVNYFIDSLLDKANYYTYRLKALTSINSSDYSGFAKITSSANGYETFKSIAVNDNLNSIAYNSDGTLIAGGGTGTVVKIWQTESGNLLKTLGGFSGNVNMVTFSPDGLLLAACSQDGTVKIWRVSDGYELHKLFGHNQSVNSISFSKDGRYIVSGSSDRSVKIWLAGDGTLVKTLNGHTAPVTSVSFSPDGDLIASSSTQEENQIKIWRMSDTSFARNCADSSSPVNTICFSPNSQYIAAGYSNSNIILWNASNGGYMMNLPGHTAAVSSIGFSADGSKIISGSYDKSVRIWRTGDGSLLNVLEGHADIVRQAVFSPDGQIVASCSYDKSIRFWRPSNTWTPTP